MYTTAELFIMAFSPPYGDGTSMRELVARTGLFSPPYGDGTDTRYQFKWNSEVFAPLRGWYFIDFYYFFCPDRFSPPYGDGTLNISQKIVKWKS